MLKHLVECGAADGGAAGTGFVFVDLGEVEARFLTPGCDVGFLLGDGEVLFVTAHYLEDKRQCGFRVGTGFCQSLAVPFGCGSL